MTVLNFPANPSVGEQYNANGIIYTWNGSAWTASDANDLDDRFVQVNGDTMTGNLNVPSLNSGPLSGMRNQLINGDFVVSQRIGFNVYATGLSSDFTADRWLFYCSGGTGEARVRTQNQIWTTARAQGLQGSLQVNNATAAYSIRQGIELQTAGQPGPFVEGSTWTISLYSLVEPSVNVSWSIGTTPGSGNFQNIVQQPSMVSLGNDRWSYTFTIGAGDAPLAGATCLMVAINPAGDQTQANQFAGIQLEPGPVASPVEARPIQTELDLCQRYYCAYSGSAGSAPYAYVRRNDDRYRGYNWDFPVRMRAVPTCTGNPSTASDELNLNACTDGLFIDFITTTGAVGGSSRIVNLTADAEL